MTVQSHTPTVVAMLESWAEKEPSKTAYTFLGERKDDVRETTYGHVQNRAKAIASLLQDCAKPGDRALLIYPPGLSYVEAFLGCLYAGVVAVPAYPPDLKRLNRSLPRLLDILSDCDASLILTDTATRNLAALPAAASLASAGLRWVATDGELPLPSAWRPFQPRPETIAFLQYTSGSTSRPKGVILTHGNVAHNLHQSHRWSGIHPHHLNVGWLPPYHDMGLIGQVLCPLSDTGCPVVLMSPLTFLSRPRRWLDEISERRGTHTVTPNFAFDLCVRAVKPEDRSRLDLSSWELAMSGSETVRLSTIKNFSEAFAASGFKAQAFFPCYGLAETTVMSTAPRYRDGYRVKHIRLDSIQGGVAKEAPPDTPGTGAFISCGSCVDDGNLVILKPGSATVLPDLHIGEICMASPSVSQGYWNRPVENADVFGVAVAGFPQRRFMRSGDLGFVANGELFITGRLKDLIKIGGKNFYPQDFELTVEKSTAAVRPGCCAVFSVEDNDRTRLIVAAEVRKTARDGGDGAVIVKTIQAAMFEEHQRVFDAVLLLSPGQISKTSSGKVQRYLCKADFQAGRLGPWHSEPPYTRRSFSWFRELFEKAGLIARVILRPAFKWR